MKRSLVVSLLIYALIILGLATLQGRLLALAIPLIVYIGAGLLFGPEGVRLIARRTLSADRTTQGIPVRVKLSITNEGPALDNVLLEDLIPAGLTATDGETRTMRTLDAGSTFEMEYELSGRRGYYSLPGISATASDHFGLFTKQIQVKLSNHLFVLPPLHRLPQVAIRPRRTLVYPGLIPARRGGPGVEFYGLREYQPGDSLRWINHRASAHYEQTIFVNEFVQERAVDVGLILDARQTTNLFSHRHSTLDHTVQAAATLADAFLIRGNRVGLLIYGGLVDWTLPGYGKIQRERILQALARARLQESQVFEKLNYLPTRVFPIRSQLVLISPLQMEDLDDIISLRARGFQLLVISPDPIDFEYRILEHNRHVDLAVRIARLERAHIFRELRRAGVRVFEWQVDTPFHLVARKALGRAPLWSRGPRQ